MATLTLKNVPELLHQRLKESAERNLRSLNNEAIYWLDKILPHQSPESFIKEARKIRKSLDKLGVKPLTAKQIQAYKNMGRP